MTETIARYSRLKVGLILAPFMLVILYAAYGTVAHYATLTHLQTLSGPKGYFFAAILLIGGAYLFLGFLPIVLRAFLSKAGAIFIRDGQVHFVWAWPRRLGIEDIATVTTDVTSNGIRSYRDVVMTDRSGNAHRVRVNMMTETAEVIAGRLRDAIAI